jgi:uncharacterized membrane protein
MNRFLAIALAVGVTLAAGTAAAARDGCGDGFFRGPAGHCRPYRGGVIVAPGLVIGSFYPGHGYWDGRRYWERREHWRGHWRYR